MGIIRRRCNKIGNYDIADSDWSVVQKQRYLGRSCFSKEPKIRQVKLRQNRILLKLGLKERLIVISQKIDCL